MTLLFTEKFVKTVLLFVLSFFLIITGIYDIKYKKIPDRYVLYICITGIMLRNLYFELETLNMIYGFLSISFFFFIINIIKPSSFGGGDIKFIVSASFFLGIYVWNSFIIAVFISFPEAVYIILKGEKYRYFPFGPYISIGIFVQTLLLLYGLT